MKNEAWECFEALLFLQNADQRRYGSVMRGFVNQYSLGNNQYPTKLSVAADVLAQHKLDPEYKEHLNKKKRAQQEKDRAQNRANSPTIQRMETSFAQKADMICWACGQKGHGINNCPNKKGMNQKDYWINKAQAHYTAIQAHLDSDSDSEAETIASRQSNRRSGSSSNRSQHSRSNRNNRAYRQGTGVFSGTQTRFEYSGLQTHTVCYPCYDSSDEEEEVTAIVLKQSIKQKPLDGIFDDVLMLDTGSSLEATIKDKKLLHSIRPAKEPVVMCTNAGDKFITQEGTLEGFGQAYFDKDQVANILGFKGLLKRAKRIVYDSDVEDAFKAYLNDGSVVTFQPNKIGMYVHKPSKQFLAATAAEDSTTSAGVSHIINSVEENRKGMTQRKYDRSKFAEIVRGRFGYATTDTCKKIVRQRLVRDLDLIGEDFDNARKIFGPERMGDLKGKGTRRRPPLALEDSIEIPKELIANHSNIILCIDVMYLFGLPMFTGVDLTVRNRGLVPVDNRTADQLYGALDVMLRHYNKAGFQIKSIHCDGEFKPLMDEVADTLEVDMNYTSGNEHVPEAERNNRVIAERFRARFSELPYQTMPKPMITRLAMECAFCLNIAPVKGGLSEYYSPYMILNQRDLTMKKDFPHSFGDYVQFPQEPDPYNSHAERMEDGIFLRASRNKQGGMEIMSLQTGHVLNRTWCKPLPITPLVIKRVHELAAKQGFKTLTAQDRKKRHYYPGHLTEGVDYIVDDDEWDDDYNPTKTTENKEYDEDAELEDESAYDKMDQEEIDDLFEESAPIDESGQLPSTEDAAEATDEEAEPDAPAEEEPPEVETVEEEEETDDQEEQPAPPEPTRTRPVRSNRFTGKYNMAMFEHVHNIRTQAVPQEEYDPEIAPVMAMIIMWFRDLISKKGHSHAQQYVLNKGLKIFGERGWQAAEKEITQLNMRNCFGPVSVKDLKQSEIAKAVEGIMLLTEKRDKSVKGRYVYNGKQTREWLSREDAASPIVSLASIMLLSVIAAKEGRDVATMDIPNAFVQAEMPTVKEGEDRVIIKITGVLVDMLVNMAPEEYGPHVVFENGKKVLYCQVLMALYGMLIAAILWYLKFRKDLEDLGFKFNPYDPCVANRMVKGSQHTICFHVDDLMSSHKDKRVNDHFLIWLNKKYGKHGEVKATRGHVHDYLGMTFDFSEKGKAKVDMIDYVKNMCTEFSQYMKPGDTANNPSPTDLFAEGTGDKVEKVRADDFHKFVAKGLFACKRARPDIHTSIALLCTRVKSPNEDDWKKLLQMMRFLNGTQDDKLILTADDLSIIKWYVDASFAVHPDFRSHTGAVMTFGSGAVQSISRKQKLNTRSSTTAELVGADDASTMILWTKLFMEEQGYHIENNILFQDNKSTMLLLNNGKRSSTKRTRAINIRYFFLTDQIAKGNLMVEYCPTDDMTGDYMTKPTQGKKFADFRAQIMGFDHDGTTHAADVEG